MERIPYGEYVEDLLYLANADATYQSQLLRELVGEEGIAITTATVDLISTPERVDANSVHNRLYAWAAERGNELARARAAAQREAAEAERATCTFRPVTNVSDTANRNPSSCEERASHHERREEPKDDGSTGAPHCASKVSNRRGSNRTDAFTAFAAAQAQWEAERQRKREAAQHRAQEDREAVAAEAAGTRSTRQWLSRESRRLVRQRQARAQQQQLIPADGTTAYTSLLHWPPLSQTPSQERCARRQGRIMEQHYPFRPVLSQRSRQLALDYRSRARTYSPAIGTMRTATTTPKTIAVCAPAAASMKASPSQLSSDAQAGLNKCRLSPAARAALVERLTGTGSKTQRVSSTAPAGDNTSTNNGGNVGSRTCSRGRRASSADAFSATHPFSARIRTRVRSRDGRLVTVPSHSAQDWARKRDAPPAVALRNAHPLSRRTGDDGGGEAHGSPAPSSAAKGSSGNASAAALATEKKTAPVTTAAFLRRQSVHRQRHRDKLAALASTAAALRKAEEADLVAACTFKPLLSPRTVRMARTATLRLEAEAAARAALSVSPSRSPHGQPAARTPASLPKPHFDRCRRWADDTLLCTLPLVDPETVRSASEENDHDNHLYDHRDCSHTPVARAADNAPQPTPHGHPGVSGTFTKRAGTTLLSMPKPGAFSIHLRTHGTNGGSYARASEVHDGFASTTPPHLVPLPQPQLRAAPSQWMTDAEEHPKSCGDAEPPPQIFSNSSSCQRPVREDNFAPDSRTLLGLSHWWVSLVDAHLRACEGDGSCNSSSGFPALRSSLSLQADEGSGQKLHHYRDPVLATHSPFALHIPITSVTDTLSLLIRDDGWATTGRVVVRTKPMDGDYTVWLDIESHHLGRNEPLTFPKPLPARVTFAQFIDLYQWVFDLV